MPLATATADPPLDPPATRLSSIGFRLGPYLEKKRAHTASEHVGAIQSLGVRFWASDYLSIRVPFFNTYRDDSVELPMPNSSMFVFPTTIPPAALILATTSASYVGTYPWSVLDAALVVIPAVHRLSLIATGRPASGDDGSEPAAIFMSTSASSKQTNAFSRCISWIRSMVVCMSTEGERAPDRRSPTSCRREAGATTELDEEWDELDRAAVMAGYWVAEKGVRRALAGVVTSPRWAIEECNMNVSSRLPRPVLRHDVWAMDRILWYTINTLVSVAV